MAKADHAGLAALPASSRPFSPSTRNLLRALATEVVDRTESSRTEALGLDGTSSAAARLIAREDGLSVGDLAARLGLSHSATVRVVDRLEAAGFATRRRSRKDGRRATLSLTAEGRSSLAAGVQAADAALDELLQQLTSGERVLFERTLEKVVVRIPGGGGEGARACRYCDPTSCGAAGCPRERIL